MAADKRPKARSAPAASSKEIMRKRAADNAYLHQDFHGALNQALIYLEERFGEGAVRDYLRQFARNFYAPLTADLRARGLAALKAHFDKIYSLEGAEFGIECGPDELVLTIAACPAVGRIRKMGLPLSARFGETENAVNAAICEGTPFEFELLEYDPESGRSVQRFSRRRP